MFLEHILNLSIASSKPPGIVHSPGGSSSLFKEVLAGISTPTIQWAMDGPVDGGFYVTQSGAHNSTTTAEDLNMSMALTIDASDETGFEGYVEVSNGNHYAQAGIDHNVINRSVDRSWIFVWSNVGGTVVGPYVNVSRGSSGNNSNNGFGWLYIEQNPPVSGATFETRYLHSATTSIIYDTSHSHTVGITSENLSTAADKLCVLALSYTANGTSAGTMTARWKQTGHGAGHSYASTPAYYSSGTTNLDTYWIIGYLVSAAYSLRWRYIGVVDKVLSESDFDSLLATTAL